MGFNWVNDISLMHAHYGVNEKVKAFDKEKLKQFLEFRMAFLDEELMETEKAVSENDAEEIVDGLIDLCVVAIGTLDALGVNSYDAWNRVLAANMAKQVGVKPSRPNPLGLPDLIKPEGWEAPSHADNHGLLTRLK